jgi:predicted GH43/DUF377 family glycosyl hydrolase
MNLVSIYNIKIDANKNKVIPLLFNLNNPERINDIFFAVKSMTEEEATEILNKILDEFNHRHFRFKNLLLEHFELMLKKTNVIADFSLHKKYLIGAYFTKEYSNESAAIFNPSIVLHPNQQEIKEDEQRFVMSLRATGEGHISSIVFKTGIISANGEISLSDDSDILCLPKKVKDYKYQKDHIKKISNIDEIINPKIFRYLPDEFTSEEAFKILDKTEKEKLLKINGSREALDSIFETNYQISFDTTSQLNSRVIFPSSKSESMGMEDVRFVCFNENNTNTYYATYTAYDGENIKIQLIKTYDFNTFNISSLQGNAAQDKGMALFPEKINGKYAMISRQGGKDISIMYSDDINFWDTFKLIQKPKRNWELTQMGNCGSPIKTKHGWLLLTHAVGPMRKYVLSASLLDINNPEIVVASLEEPLLMPKGAEREGYVPNVVYSCGFIKNNDELIIPYAMSDSATSFARVNLNSLLEKLLIKTTI